MKKRILLITVLSLLLVLIAGIEVKTYFYHRGMEVIRTEYYKNDSDVKYNNFDTLEIAYQRSGKSVLVLLLKRKERSADFRAGWLCDRKTKHGI